jgi:hypothetical protein
VKFVISYEIQYTLVQQAGKMNIKKSGILTRIGRIRRLVVRRLVAFGDWSHFRKFGDWSFGDWSFEDWSFGDWSFGEWSFGEWSVYLFLPQSQQTNLDFIVVGRNFCEIFEYSTVYSTLCLNPNHGSTFLGLPNLKMVIIF